VYDLVFIEHLSLKVNSIFEGTVLLHLYAGALARRLSPSEPMRPIPTLYIPVPSPFPVLEAFIADTAKRYNLDLFLCKPPNERVESVATPPIAPTQSNGNLDGNTGVDQTQIPRALAVGKAKGGEGMRQALDIYKTRFPNISAILVGTRRSDPHGGVCVSILRIEMLIFILCKLRYHTEI
jgi:FAD synthetase